MINLKKTNIKINVHERQAFFYDDVYAAQGKNYKKEANKIFQIIKKYKISKGKRLLDVGCGTGGHFPFLSKWYKVEGLDLDKYMLEIAKKKFKNILFHHDNMINFSLENKFDVITCLFSAIGYTKTVENMQATIINMAKHLNPGGILILEPWFSPDRWPIGKPYAVFVNKPNLKVARVYLSERKNNISVVNFHVLAVTPEKIEEFTELQELGLFTKEEYLRGFKLAGLKVKHNPVGLIGRGLYIGLKI